MHAISSLVQLELVFLAIVYSDFKRITVCLVVGFLWGQHEEEGINNSGKLGIQHISVTQLSPKCCKQRIICDLHPQWVGGDVHWTQPT